MATVVKSFAIQGVDGYTVDIESKVLDGQPMISIIGMGDVAVKEAGDRIQSAIDERDECADYKQRNHYSNRVFFWNYWFFLA